MMINIPDFYPTPISIIRKMLSDIKLDEINSILEPSAGKGDIVDYIVQKVDALHPSWHNDKREKDIDCIEIDENLQHILKGKGYRVIHNDFLTFNTFKRYGLVVMNPPFSDGEKHLLKALEIQQSGGRIVCLLNAETIRNPFSNARKDLVLKLDELGADIEFIQDAFIDAERKTAVEIAMIKVNIPEAAKESIILEDLKSEESFQQSIFSNNELVDADPICGIVARYYFEVKAGLKLIDEYEAMKPHLLCSLKPNSSATIFELKVDGSRSSITRNEFIKMVRAKYWEALFMSDMFVNHFTTNLRSQYISKIQELSNYDFSLYNIYSIKAEIIKTMSKSIEDTILALFDEFSHKHHWHEETGKNIHYYNGWKTNQSWYINKRVIIPLSAYSWGELRLSYTIENKLEDIEKVFDYLDGGVSNHVDLRTELKKAQDLKQTTKIPLKYFNITVYKKGTTHIEFTNLDLLKKFNLFGSQRKGWLPPSYGKAKYEDMSPEEKAVINDFEGVAEYRKVMAKKDYFICDSVGLLALADKGAAA